MATKEELRQRVQAMRENLSKTLDGMDYCLDWKSTDEEWSAREVLYHLVDTPPGGIHSSARSILHGDISELTLPPDMTDTSGGRAQADMPQIMLEIEAVLAGLESVIDSATDADLEKSLPVHLPARGTTEERTLGRIIEGSMDYHWADHLEQLVTLREGLGLA